MIRFLSGAILGGLIGYGLATLGRIPVMRAEDVERRTRPNVVPLSRRDWATLHAFVNRPLTDHSGRYIDRMTGQGVRLRMDPELLEADKAGA